MQPHIDATHFGDIVIDGTSYDHDVVIRLNGKIKKRKKKLSKKRYGTSHTVAREEAEHIHDDGAERLIVGTGQNGRLGLSEEAEALFRERGCAIEALPTPRAAEAWNNARGAVIALFHTTC